MLPPTFFFFFSFETIPAQCRSPASNSISKFLSEHLQSTLQAAPSFSQTVPLLPFLDFPQEPIPSVFSEPYPFSVSLRSRMEIAEPAPRLTPPRQFLSFRPPRYFALSTFCEGPFSHPVPLPMSAPYDRRRAVYSDHLRQKLLFSRSHTTHPLARDIP